MVNVFPCSAVLENHEIIQHLTGLRGFTYREECGTHIRGEAAGLISGVNLGQPLF